jgi:NAD(P)-dependent dehydrogenase (short-subunit alcohol dehydrogenase family)
MNVLVNNAAHWQADAFTPGGAKASKADEWPPRSPELTAASIDAHLAVNTRAVALMMTEFARRLAAGGA